MVKFGDFREICETVALTVCPLVDAEVGIEPTCYSRNAEIANTLIFQPGTYLALRREFLFFFYK
jgi:hypothetical protein